MAPLAVDKTFDSVTLILQWQIYTTKIVNKTYKKITQGQVIPQAGILYLIS